MTIGILALQGDFAKHQEQIDKLGEKSLLVKTKSDLFSCDGLIIPGGESTSLTTLMKKHGLWDDIYTFALQKPVFGTCAGLIVLSTQIITNNFQTLKLLDIAVTRNAYGRQIDSFIDTVDVRLESTTFPFKGVFIRAPKINRLGENVVPLAWHKNDIVLAEGGNILVSTFHPELTDDPRIHQYFLEKINKNSSKG